jgi:hypothetical protein
MLKKIIIITCLIGAIASSVASLTILSPSHAQQRWYKAHDALEQIAFRDGFREASLGEIQKAVTDERAAAKDWLVKDGLNHILVYLCIGFSLIALLVTIISLRQPALTKLKVENK